MTNDTSHNHQHPTELDASEFGNHVRQGGWRLGLLVARNVEKGEAGRPVANCPDRDNSAKASAREFAELSGVGKNRVLRYLAAWNLAAEQGHVPASADLSPGQNIDLHVDALPAWNRFYEAKNTSLQPPTPIAPSVEQVTEAVRSNPEYAKAVSEFVEPTREQVTKAMRSNPEIADAARDEAWEITKAKAQAQSSQAGPYIAPEDKPSTKRNDRADVAKFVFDMHKASKALDSAAETAQMSSFRDPNILQLTELMRMKLDVIDTAMKSGSFDEEIAKLIDSEAGR